MTVSCVSQRMGSTLLVRENAESPSDAEWSQLLKLLEALLASESEPKILIVTDGGGPSGPQRKRLEATLKGRDNRKSLKVAVLSDDLKVRFVASTIALFHRHHRSFAKSELGDACDHLGVQSREQRLAIEKALSDMERLLR